MAANDKEIWKQVTHIKEKTGKKYAVSSKAQIASYDTKIDDLFVLKQHLNGGFPMVTIHVNDKTKALFIHHAVAHSFLKKPSSKHNHVLHLDYNKANNDPSNLKWATRQEQVEHSMKSPYVLQAAARKVYTGATSKKLNEKKVTQLKKEIWNPKRKLTFKQLAAKYNIAEMNLYRIKNGESWFHVHVEGEPIFEKYKTQLKNIEFHAKLDAKKQLSIDKRRAATAARKKIAADLKKKEADKKKEAKIKKAKEKKANAINAKLLKRKKKAEAKKATKQVVKKTAKKAPVKKAAVKKTVKKSVPKKVAKKTNRKK